MEGQAFSASILTSILRGHLIRVGELARAAGVATSTIRFYERVGLLPEPARTPAGYRDYDRASLDRLAFIHAGRAIGLSVAELREIIALRERGQAPCARVTVLLQQRMEEVSGRIAELQRIQAHLRWLAARARRLDPATCTPARVCQVVVDPETPLDSLPPER